jgi:hypothetical protein
MHYRRNIPPYAALRPSRRKITVNKIIKVLLYIAGQSRSVTNAGDEVDGPRIREAALHAVTLLSELPNLGVDEEII